MGIIFCSFHCLRVAVENFELRERDFKNEKGDSALFHEQFIEGFPREGLKYL